MMFKPSLTKMANVMTTNNNHDNNCALYIISSNNNINNNDNDNNNAKINCEYLIFLLMIIQFTPS